MMAEEYGIQTTIVLAEDSMAKVAEKVGKMFANKISSFQSGMKYPSAAIGPTATPGMGVAAKAGALTGKGTEKAMAGMGKTMGKMSAKMGYMAIIAMILANLMRFIDPFIKLLSFLVLILLVPVFRLLKTAMGGIVSFFADPLGALAGLGTAIVDGLMGIFTGAGNFIGGLVTGAKEAAGNIIKTVVDALGPIGQVLYDAIKNVWDTAMTIFGTIGTYVLDTIKNVWDTATTIFSGIGTYIWESLQNVWNTAVKVFELIGEFIWNLLTGQFDKAFANLIDIGKTLIEMFTKQFELGIALISTIGQALIDGILKQFTLGVDALSKIGSSLVTLIFDQIKLGLNVLGGLGKSVYDIVTNIASEENRRGPLGTNIGGEENILTWNPMSWGAGLGKLLGYGSPKENDFISRAGGEITSFSPDDTIIGVKDINKLGGGGMTYAPVYNVQAGVDGSLLEKIFREHDDNFRREFLGRSSYVTNIRP